MGGGGGKRGPQAGNLGTRRHRAAGVAIAVRGVRGHSDAVLGAGRHRGGGRHARAAVRAVGAVDAVCVLGAGAAVVAEGVGGVETRPSTRPPKGTQNKSLDAAVA
ncbi:hypothetical protein Ctob_014175 [Chrysochromulina tobinii]|uniref:Uncharacterized protein n=1 Tax=Chrysochromulina tobinii TaxID=1460289 RepID=A0A0M0K6X0_9EUKA|nr:hypothetical protein Ctob_014175 [Chrysochromulina tobinii]|eukprot:KOO34352.1 hypothetical protein Ctob_014175 [Chrysochromulina sp. CCMP291]